MIPGIIWDRLADDTAGNVRFVLGRLPGWEEYAETVHRFVVFRVPCPNPVVRAAASLDDERGYVVLSVGSWGLVVSLLGWRASGPGHSSWAVHGSPAEQVAHDLDRVIDFIGDGFGIRTTYSRDGRRGDDYLVAIPYTEWDMYTRFLPAHVARVTLRTWSGEGDRDWPEATR